ncbi:MAG TPA: hypothetical protein VEI07_26225 [Planctomycetaceae bacterium]|nr:hypothetical protein [Planctomycetaceae bacterium]
MLAPNAAPMLGPNNMQMMAPNGTSMLGPNMPMPNPSGTQVFAPNGTPMFNPNGTPMLAPYGAAPYGAPTLSPNGTPMPGPNGMPLQGNNGVPIVGPNGMPMLDSNGMPIPNSAGAMGTPNGTPIVGPNGTLLNPDGTPYSGSLAPTPEGSGPPPNPGPPRLRMSEDKDKIKEADPQPVVEEGAKPIPASLVFRTRDILRADVLRGKNYRIAEYAPLVDFNFRFEIETPWGTIPAHGLAMLDLRLRELCSLEYASRIADKNPMFTEGFAQAVCNTACGTYILVTDPIGSVRRTGQVLKRWALIKKSPGGCKANCEARRRLACLVGCDPETRNEPLACLLDEMSINATGGWLAVEIGLDFGPPGLGFLPFNAQFKKIMEHRSTLEIQEDLNTALIELGVPEASRTRFFSAPSYTTTQRMAFVYWLRKSIGIENLSSLVDGAADTRNESEAMAAIRELQLIADLRHTQPLARVTFIGVPVLTLDDGSQIIVTVADYLVDTPRTAQMIAAYREKFPHVTTKLATLGRVSAGAQKQFTAAGIEVIRHKLGQAEPAKDATRTASAKPGAQAPPSEPSSTDASTPSPSAGRS